LAAANRFADYGNFTIPAVADSEHEETVGRSKRFHVDGSAAPRLFDTMNDQPVWGLSRAHFPLTALPLPLSSGGTEGITRHEAEALNNARAVIAYFGKKRHQARARHVHLANDLRRSKAKLDELEQPLSLEPNPSPLTLPEQWLNIHVEHLQVEPRVQEADSQRAILEQEQATVERSSKTLDWYSVEMDLLNDAFSEWIM
jgi:hypothetical protein